jgi:hypothetical protein
MSLRDKIIETALFYDGACPTHRKDEYVDLLTRGGQESAQTAKDMTRMSSCALAVRGFWFATGIRHKWLLERYHNGMAPRDVIEIAQSFDAVMDGKKIGSMPPDWDGDNPYVYPYCLQPGDSFYILFPHNGKGEHFGTVVNVKSFDPKTKLVIDAIEGGQSNGGIMKVERTFNKRGAYWVDAKSGRSLFSWFDADKLVATG